MILQHTGHDVWKSLVQYRTQQQGGVQVAGVGSLCCASEVLGWLQLLSPSHMVLRTMIWLEILLPLSMGSEMHKLHLLAGMPASQDWPAAPPGLPHAWVTYGLQSPSAQGSK